MWVSSRSRKRQPTTHNEFSSLHTHREREREREREIGFNQHRVVHNDRTTHHVADYFHNPKKGGGDSAVRSRTHHLGERLHLGFDILMKREKKKRCTVMWLGGGEMGEKWELISPIFVTRVLSISSYLISTIFLGCKYIN